MNMTNYTPLARLSPALSNLTNGEAPGYRKLNYLVLDGKIRTVLINGRHYVPTPDLPMIAQMLGLQVPETAPSAADSSEHWSPADIGAAQSDTLASA